MGTTPIYGLPVPPLTGVQPDGPDGFQDLADKLELTLINEARVFSQNLTNDWSFSSGVKEFDLTAVPLNRPVFMACHLTAQVPSYQYMVAEIKEGSTVVSQSTLGSSPWSFTGPMTVSAARTFTTIPKLRLILGISAASHALYVRMTGMGFGWAS